MADLEDIVKNGFRKALAKEKDNVRLKSKKYGDVYNFWLSLEDEYFEEYGFLRFAIVPEKLAICSYLYVNEFYRGEGLGRGIVEALEDISRETGIKKIQVKMVTNKEFWGHMGYHRNILEYDQDPSEKENLFFELVYEKELK